MPEMFRREINELSYENRQKFTYNRLEFHRADGENFTHDLEDTLKL